MKNEIVSILTKLPKDKDWTDSKKSLRAVIIYLLKDSTAEEIISVADEVHCSNLLGEILWEHYDKIDSINFARLASKYSTLPKKEDEDRKSYGGYYYLPERMFARSKDSSSWKNSDISNLVLKKILDSEFFSNTKNLEKVIVNSRHEDFTSELLCLNKLPKVKFSLILKKYFAQKRQIDGQFLCNGADLVYRAIDHFIQRRDCYPGKNLSLDYFSFDEFNRILNSNYVGSDFIKDSIKYIGEKNPKYLIKILRNALANTKKSESNSSLLSIFVKKNYLNKQQILTVANRYPDDRWLLEACLESKSMQTAKKEKDHIQSLVNIISERWSRQNSSYHHGGIH